jgi:AraC-like DNA-binding protein
MERVELIPGKRFREVARPLGLAAPFPYRVAFNRLHLVEAKYSHHVRRHQHRDYEIMLIENGTYEATINDQLITLRRNGVAVIKPGDFHEDCTPGEVAFMSLSFAVQPGPDSSTSANLFIDDMPPAAQALTTDGSLHAIARRIHAEAARGDTFSAALQDALTLEFACGLARAVPSGMINPRLLAIDPHHAFAGGLLGFFEDHLGDNLGLAEMAKAMAMSERSLSARCRSAFSTSPTRLFVRFKMERARTLLMQTDRPIKEISRWLGFENPYHFSTVYKRVHGQPPTQHRA